MSKGSKSRPRTRSSSPVRHTSRRSWSAERDSSRSRDRVDYSDLPQQHGPLPETIACGPTTTHQSRAEVTVSRPDSDTRTVEEAPVARLVVLTQREDPL